MHWLKKPTNNKKKPTNKAKSNTAAAAKKQSSSTAKKPTIKADKKPLNDKLVKPNIHNNKNNNIFNGIVRLVKIKDGYLFKSNESEKTHNYAVYKDEKTKEVRAVQSTHLYLPDEKRMQKLNKGLLLKVKLNGFETPSGMNNYYFATDKDGNKIDLNSKEIVSIDNTPIGYTQGKKIIDFAKDRYEKGKKQN